MYLLIIILSMGEGSMKWGKAFIYGLKYLALSALFNVLGALLILSSLSISTSLNNGKLTVTVNVNKALSNLGLTALLLLGFSTLVIGNVSVFMKILSEAIKESHTDFIW